MKFITDTFIPARVHVREQAEDFKRFATRYDAQWTPTILELDPDGSERHRIEGFLVVDDLLAQLKLGLGHHAFKRQEWTDAQQRFREVAEAYPMGDSAPEAVYWAGVSRYKASNDGAALRQTADALTKDYPDTSWAKKASIWIQANP